MEDWPATVDEAVDRLIARLSLKDKATIARMRESDLVGLNMILGFLIGEEFGLWEGNKQLMRSCCSEAGKPELDAGEAGAIIIKKMWKKLKKEYELKLLK